MRKKRSPLYLQATAGGVNARRVGFRLSKKALLPICGIAFISGLGFKFWPQPSPVATIEPQPPVVSPPQPLAITANNVPATEETVDEPAPAEAPWIEHRVNPGESLAAIFKQYDLSARTLHTLIHSDDHVEEELARLQPGETLKILRDEQGKLEKLVYQPSLTETIALARKEDRFDIERIFTEPQRELEEAGGFIRSSLYLDGKRAGLNDGLIMELTEIFGWDIDFARSIRSGDQFSVLYEKHYVDGKHIGEGPIMAAEFVNQGKIYRALRFTSPDGDSDYYTPEGKSLRKKFLRTPVKSARITSRFTLRRNHPILHRIRAHKGVDYAAPTGTPVRATGDGKIIFRGRKGGYGRVVILDHGRGYTTLYAHLSRFSSRYKRGARVKQGDTIAYVGQSGLATGPHLHYEFRIAGVHRDPLTVPLPGSEPIPPSQLASFKQQTAPLLASLEQYHQTLLAQAKPEE
ncbi:MAG: peptidoglycan DD-metalloendopeptidase family protein [Methylohalobius crimeensis]